MKPDFSKNYKIILDFIDFFW